MGEAVQRSDETEAEQAYAQGLAAEASGDVSSAEACFRRALAAAPDHMGALLGLAVLRANAGGVIEALHLLQAAIKIDPTESQARFNLGSLLLTHGEVDAAVGELLTALDYRPDFPEALVNLARARVTQGDVEAGLVLLARAEAIAPHMPAVLTNLGALLMSKGQYAEAGHRYALVLHQDPGSAEAAYNVANALKALGRYGEAIAFYDQALGVRPDYVDALVNKANTLRELEQLDAALAGYRQALAYKPDDARLYLNLGQILRDRGDADEAREALRRALAIDPDDAQIRLASVMAELPLVYADEAGIDRARTRYAEALAALEAWAGSPERRKALARAVGMSQPFYLAYQGRDDRDLQRAYGALIGRAIAESFAPPPFPPPPKAGERIRVGVVSGFFRAHSNWKIPIKGWLMALDRSRFEVIGYQTNAKRDERTEEAERLCDRFVQGPLSIEAWRARIAQDAPHVLLYPEVGMDPTTPRLAAQRLAPVQCASWGHPDTTGLAEIDFFLSSDLMEPDGAEAYYGERLARLPGLGVWLEPPTPTKPAARAAIGCRDDEIVFWCGQSLPKYLPRFDAVWPRIARAVGPCRFVFIGLPTASRAEKVFRERLAAAFTAEDLDVDQYCVVLSRMPESDFSAAIGAADIFLDSFEWSGCNSALEAIAHDLPIVTCPGAFMRGRHGAAILRVMDVTETVARDIDAYVEIASRLAKDPAWCARIRGQVAAGKSRLYRDASTVRALESFLEAAVRDSLGG